jgi:hypothetical protein
MVSTLDLTGGPTLTSWGHQGNNPRLVSAEMFASWCDNAPVSKSDASVPRSPAIVFAAGLLRAVERRAWFGPGDVDRVLVAASVAYGLDWYDMLSGGA